MIDEKSSSPTENFPLPRLCLASQSPRRRQLLETLGMPFSWRAPVGDELDASVANVEKITQLNSLAKAKEIHRQLEDTSEIVLAADTLVVLENQVLGKPKNPEEAVAMVNKLSGRTHRVVTGISLLSTQFGLRQATDESRVTFRKLSEQDILDYVATREPHDKAGAYAVQGLGALFIERIDGSYTNVMGLPIEVFLRELAQLTRTSVYAWFK